MIQGKAIKFGNNIDTDQMIAAHHLTLPSIGDMSRYAFENHPNFTECYLQGDIIVAEENFGCGSSREQAPAVLRELGVGAIVARSFARIFFRNGINLGIPLIECDQAWKIKELDELEFDGETLRNHTTNDEYLVKPHPSFINDIYKSGGIVKHLMGKNVRSNTNIW